LTSFFPFIRGFIDFPVLSGVKKQQSPSMALQDYFMKGEFLYHEHNIYILISLFLSFQSILLLPQIINISYILFIPDDPNYQSLTQKRVKCYYGYY
jgi:hypothetical protein